MAAGFLIFVCIILCGILAVLGLIFSVIYFATGNKSKYIWLGVFIAGLIGLMVSIFVMVDRVTRKAKNFAHNFEKTLEKSAMNSEVAGQYYWADSLGSQQIRYLKLIEPAAVRDQVPEQFYNYLGFGGYYRLPLRYPFSIHCIDSLNYGSLYNEAEVQRFDVSDNGEIDCGISDIEELVFDQNILIASLHQKNKKDNRTYLIYHFEDGKTETTSTLDDLTAKAKKSGFTRPLHFISLHNYFSLVAGN